jgi:micrococcal nuclease
VGNSKRLSYTKVDSSPFDTFRSKVTEFPTYRDFSMKRIFIFTGWAISGFMGLIGLAGLATPSAPMGAAFLIWAIAFAPPVYGLTKRWGVAVNILGRIAVLLISLIAGALLSPSTVAKTPITAPSSSVISPSPLVVAASPSPTNSIISVGDGDSIRVNQGGKTITVRLACVDAPESDQPLGKEATKKLKTLLPKGRQVDLRVVDTDKYGRTVAEVSANGQLINLAMVESGHAIAYRDYLQNCDGPKFLAAEASAKTAKLAHWSQAEPIAPSDWRKGVRPAPVALPPTAAEIPPPPTVEIDPPAAPQNTAEIPSRSNLPSCVNSDCNCSDFSSQAEVDAVMQAYPSDPFGLDRDGDGAACESL